MQISIEERLKLVEKIRQFQVLQAIAMYPHIVICGPSGSGKSTLTRTDQNSIMRLKPNVFDFSVSGCTRILREDEINGQDYYHLSHVDFALEDFFETNEYVGNKKLYGTLVSEIERIAVTLRKRIIFDIDPNGAMKIQEAFGNDVFVAFLNTSDPYLEARLLKRAEKTKETPDDIKKRLIAAGKERKLVETGAFKPDLVIPYDTIPVGEASNLILLEAHQKVLQFAA